LTRASRGAAYAVALAVTGLAASPVTAHASDVTVSGIGLFYFASAGETNGVTVSGDTTGYLVHDTGVAGITEGPGCTQVDAITSHCDLGAVRALRIELDDGSDGLTIIDSAYPPGPPTGDPPITAAGGDGNDTLRGGGGQEDLTGGAGADQILGGGGEDRVDGQAGNDALVDGGDGNDPFVSGGDGDDVVDGGAGNDAFVSGGSGRDTVLGGAGDDRILDDEAPPSGASGPAATVEADVVRGGDGVDRADYEPRKRSLNVSLDGVANDGEAGESDNVESDVEQVTGGADSDSLTGSDAANMLDGGPGDDLLTGLGGDDVIQGGANDGGSDGLAGGPGNDVMRGGAGDDSVDGGDDDDVLSGEGGGDTVAGGAGQDTLAGGPGIDTLDGGDGNDRLNGGDVPLVGADGGDDINGGNGDDDLLGGPGNDRLDGGLGDDGIGGGSGSDVVSYQDRDGPVRVTFDGKANDGEQRRPPAPSEKDNIGDDVENIIGGTVGDTLLGDDGINVIDAGSGDDYVDGRDGRDTLAGGTGADVIRARDGVKDEVACGDGVDLAILDRFDTRRDCDYVDRGRRRRPPLGRAALVRPTRPAVRLLRLPGSSRFVDIGESVEVPLGSTLNPPRKGAVRVTTTKVRRGTVQQAVLSRGRFTVNQGRGARPFTEFRLAGGDFSVCRRPTVSRGSVRSRLLARVDKRRHGRNRVRGRYSDATSYATTWLTEDRCDGTLTRVLEGTVHVRDHRRHRTVVVRASHAYLARAPARRPATRPGGSRPRP
jgi:Ca2+-binding RTX toxin-like protein